MNDSERIFAELEAPDQPASCDLCGEIGTNASMQNHECNDQIEQRMHAWASVLTCRLLRSGQVFKEKEADHEHD